MSERGSVRFGNTTIGYEVRRSERRRKTVQITMDGGGVQVAAPMTTPPDELRAIVRRRAPWILSHASGEMLETAPKRFVSGETLPYLGRNVRMIVDAGEVHLPEVRFDHWRFRVAVPEGLEGEERQQRIRRAIVGWYRDRAAERLPNLVKRWWPRLGQGERSRVLIRDQRQRWGSCAPDGTLRFNWRAMMLPPALIEYIVVHELAHLTHRNHSTDFWSLMAEVMPDTQQRRQRLREAGCTLPL
ncbi:MAG: M48 family metallopeptidase [Caldilineaceae bacterium SB0668_bin_21]|nr:M48 family metallopeptidase [Caldilineaceae bacterium SB0668_bin_21]MYC22527.1 M48 family metallopeptidase [Caldilineaceae bacterium SB0662_bin_25]